jgi:hypothetical protein
MHKTKIIFIGIICLMPKKIIFSLLVFILLIGGVLSYLNKNKILSYENTDLIAEKTSEKIYTDSDNDGLKDWEEDLWKTNINKADTDEDGTNDFEEIREGRDPLKNGPNDKLDQETIKNKINPSLESDLTETDKFSRELFAKYVNARESGDFKSGDYASLMLQYAEKASKEDIVIYKETDIKTIQANKESMKEYGNNLAKIIKAKNKEYPLNEMFLLDKVTKEKPETKEKIEEFKNIAGRYSGIKEEMLKMSAPENVVRIHTQLINVLGIMSVSVENMQYIFNDPVKAMSWVAIYPHTADVLVESLKDLRRYFLENKIIFNTKEDGSLFTSGV